MISICIDNNLNNKSQFGYFSQFFALLKQKKFVEVYVLIKKIQKNSFTVELRFELRKKSIQGVFLIGWAFITKNTSLYKCSFSIPVHQKYFTLLNFSLKRLMVSTSITIFRIYLSCHNWFPKGYKKVNSIERFFWKMSLKRFLLYYRCISKCMYTYLYMCLDVCDQYTILCANTKKKQSLFSHLLFSLAFLKSLYTQMSKSI